MNYYEHHLGDYVRDTAHLSMLEDGAYRRLLDAYYIREAPLPAAFREVFRLVRAQSKSERDAVETVLREFFEETPEGWRHRRCDAEVSRFQDKQRKARASAEARWNKPNAHSEGNANADANASPATMRTHSEGNAPTRTGAHPSPVPSNQSPVSKEKDPPAARVPHAKGCRLAADWEPGEPGMVFAKQQGLVNGKAVAELAKFRDYWLAQPGQKGVKTDWQATWRNWVRRSAEVAGGRAQQQGGDDMFAGAR